MSATQPPPRDPEDVAVRTSWSRRLSERRKPDPSPAVPVAPETAGQGAPAETAALSIRLFGNLGLTRTDRPLGDFATSKSKALFSYLVLNRGRLHSRDALMGILWGDRPDSVARKNLRTDIWRLRRILEPRGVRRGTYVIARNDTLGFNAEADHWLDVDAFERAISRHERSDSRSLTPSDAAELRSAVQLYRGDLLEELYDDWCVLERERLRARFLAALEKLMRYHASRREWPAAIPYGRRILEEDPLREHIHRDLMRYLYYRGDRPAAVAQYRECARLLARELDIEPMRETSATMEAIDAETLAGSDGDLAPGHTGAPRPSRSSDPEMTELREALTGLRDAAARLLSALDRVDQAPPRDR